MLPVLPAAELKLSGYQTRDTVQLTRPRLLRQGWAAAVGPTSRQVKQISLFHKSLFQNRERNETEKEAASGL